MDRMEGLWYSHFTAGSVQGDGMAVLRQGEIVGGDPIHTYSGSYGYDGPNLYVNIRVSPYLSGRTPTDLQRPLNFFLRGLVREDSGNISGHADNKPDLAVAVELHKAA
jgi:hypothetical protein